MHNLVFLFTQDDYKVEALIVELHTRVNNKIGKQRLDVKCCADLPANIYIDKKSTWDPVKDPMHQVDERYFPEVFDQYLMVTSEKAHIRNVSFKCDVSNSFFGPVHEIFVTYQFFVTPTRKICPPPHNFKVY
jgi:hypothetical protein